MTAERRLYLLRHGEAANSKPDSDRPLTAPGRTQIDTLAAGLMERGFPRPRLIAVSPYRRARESASVLVRHLTSETQQPPLLTSETLVPNSGRHALGAWLESLPSDQWPVLLIGHQPLLGELLSWLTDRPELSATVSTASFHAVDFGVLARGCGQLAWQAYP